MPPIIANAAKLVSSQSECNAKVVPAALVKMHFEAYIDESSSAGTPGEKFESTKDRNKMFELMMDKNTQKGWEGVFMDLCIGTKGSNCSSNNNPLRLASSGTRLSQMRPPSGPNTINFRNCPSPRPSPRPGAQTSHSGQPLTGI